jgi:tetratricopeptide (TPR) repeat protein
VLRGAFPSLYSNIAKCYEDLGNLENAKKNYELANSFKEKIFDRGPFYHGTKADLQIGDVLTPGRESNYKSEFIMNHIYFTALVNGVDLLRH